MASDMHIAYIGLGSNLDNPIQQVTRALLELDQLSNSYLLAYSSLYQSKAMTLDDHSADLDELQLDYINAVAKLATALEPLQLLDMLQAIENAHERVRKKRWGARTLDLDILLYDHTIITSDESDNRLIVPHYGLPARDFVLLPLAEISPNLVLPDGSELAALIHNCEQSYLKQLDLQQLD
ncbi:2-amino-4-hydroxy-6-hydroxymethyldihydropteridine diphosphokinase [Kangiella sp. TOML190]|uniref:2-amino-4-hydroxy-6- hydroxymethyldihydropteridine diphosphokinase n=1 Tax=Kangiella sp. TOML190 TaxID=2931351 RepID=UPI00203DE06A|nr:2-amino-4-hydroxy-6-hydroxymethyldihydropteridine diphosphokinase [Kangiella sp. TOML190]